MPIVKDEPAYKGRVSNFTGTHIDNDGIPYFVFALRVEGSQIPYEYVLYANLNEDQSRDIVVAVTQAWAHSKRVAVYLDVNLEQKMRVRDVRCID